MSLLPQYTHIIKANLKHIYLSFDAQGNLVIKSPNVSKKRIEKLLISKSSWIRKSQKKLEQKKGKALDFTKSLEVYFLGEPHPLHLIPSENKKTKLTFDGDIFCIYYSVYDEIIFQKHIDKFYKKEAILYISTQLKKWGNTMSLTYNHVSFRKTKRQWGSCSRHNNISFNTMMMKLPLSVIEYIIVHELSHIQHKHHQASFWELVASYLPEYKKEIQKLKHYST